MSEISGRPLNGTKAIAMDGTFDQDSSHKALPGMFFNGKSFFAL